MIIEIRMAGFVNKGAELMLLAIIQKIKERYPDAQLVMAPCFGGQNNDFSTFINMQKNCLLAKAWLWKYDIQWGNFAKYIPKKLRNMYGIVLDSEIDVVLDAAGFAYSDQWGTTFCNEASTASSNWKKNNVLTIFLPQAFGPFKIKKNIKSIKKLLNNVDLIFARENDSYKYLIDTEGKMSNVKIYPDFTNLIKGIFPEDIQRWDNMVAIVPNSRMIDKSNSSDSEKYISFIVRCINILKSKNVEPFILVHEMNDVELANKISKITNNTKIIINNNSIHIKGIIGECDAVIGSRFHALISALSQGVPALATGWSHKYARLFEDYNFEEGILSVNDNDEVIANKIDFLLNYKNNGLKDIIYNSSVIQKKKTEEMWNLVFEKIDSHRN